MGLLGLSMVFRSLSMVSLIIGPYNKNYKALLATEPRRRRNQPEGMANPNANHNNANQNANPPRLFGDY